MTPHIPQKEKQELHQKLQAKVQVISEYEEQLATHFQRRNRQEKMN